MKFIGWFLFIYLLQSCYVSKTLDREVKVQLDTNFSVEITNTGNSTFSSNYSEEEYRTAFMNGMKAEFSGSSITVVESGAEFRVKIQSLDIRESTTSETVNDEASSDNGKTFELSNLNLDSKGDLIQLSNSVSRDWWADKSKDEKVTNSRSAGQVVTGGNKDNTEYREKEFSNDIALDLAEKCGRRSGVRIINEIVKVVK